MCDKCGSVCSESHGLDAVDAYRIDEAAAWVLGQGDPVELAKKEKNPLVLRDIVAIEVKLSDTLRAVAVEQGDYAMGLLGKLLDADFEVSAAGAKSLIEQVAAAYPKYGAAIADAAVPMTEETAEQVLALTRKRMALKRGFSELPPKWISAYALKDEKAIEALGKRPAMWIADYYKGPKVEQARGIIERAMEAGLGREQTADFLKAALGESFKDYRYWDVLSSSVTTKARSWGVFTTMQAAGYDTYRILPVGDARTCDVCLSLSKHEFKVAKAMNIMESTFGDEDPESVKEKAPWLSWDKSRNGGKGEAYYVKGGRANYIGDRSGESLQNSGLGITPVHGRCRCVPVLVE